MTRFLDFEDDERIGSVCWCGGCAADPCSYREHEAKAYTYGAAAAFGIIGMFEAIRQRDLRETYGDRFVLVEATCIHGLYHREHCQACEDLDEVDADAR